MNPDPFRELGEFRGYKDPHNRETRPTRAVRLPDFPWDVLAPYAVTARAHPNGIVDLSMGTPVDATPMVAQQALAQAADAPGYPLTAGMPALREALVRWLSRRCGAVGLTESMVLPTIGSKELVAWLPSIMGLGTDDVVVMPALSYPTYEVGAALAGARVVRADSPMALGSVRPALIWINSPANPTGQMLSVDELRMWVRWAREHGVILVSDECYFELGWDADAVSILDPLVCGVSHEGILAVHSLSKRSNLAGYRAGFVAGDARLIAEILEVRKHAGLLVPTPVQAAMVAVLDDDAHATAQRERYATRRLALRAALLGADFQIGHSVGGLYLWATRHEDCWKTVSWLAERGILASPGIFYGPTGDQHVRLALTATDERIASAISRLTI